MLHTLSRSLVLFILILENNTEKEVFAKGMNLTLTSDQKGVPTGKDKDISTGQCLWRLCPHCSD